MAEISVQLSANIKSLESALKKAKAELRSVGDVADKEGGKIAKGGDKGAKGLGNLKKSTTNVTPTLLEFNRVVQDAPFGIQGVANNLTQLTQNFGDLSKSSGGSVNALKALVGGFIGPAGILFAVSAVTSLLVTYGDKLKAGASLTSTLAKATAEFVSAAYSEVNALRTLVTIAQDENISKKARQGAIDKINEKYPEYLGNLDLENVKTKEVQASVDALSKSLIKQAQVKGLESAISKVYEESGEELTELMLKQRAAAKQVKAEVKSLTGLAAFESVDTDLPITKQIKQITDIVNKNKGAGKGLLTSLGFATENYNDAVSATSKFKKDMEGELSPIQELLNEFTVDSLFNELVELDNGVTVTGKKTTESLKNTFVNLSEIFKVQTNDLQKDITAFNNTIRAGLGDVFSKPLADSVQKALPQFAAMEQALLDFNERADDIIRNGISDAFSGIGEAIGSSLINGTNLFQSIGASLLGSLGSLLTQMGKMAISVGVGLIKIKAALASLNPGIAIAAGVALVAVGSAFSGASRSLSSNIGGGGGGGGFSSSGIGGQSSISSGASSSNSNFGVSGNENGRVVFEIAGTKLVGVLSRTLDRNSRLGGQLSLS